MTRLVLIPSIAFAIFGIACLPQWWSTDFADIEYRDKQKNIELQADAIESRTRYDLLLKDISLMDDDVLFWRILASKDTVYDLNKTKIYDFQSDEKYVVEVYKNMRLADVDTISPEQGFFADINIKRSSLIIGDSLLATNGGNSKSSMPVKWLVSENDEVVASSDQDSLVWIPSEPGNYEISLTVELEDGLSLYDKDLFTVNKKEEKKVEKKPKYVAPVLSAAELARRQAARDKEQAKREADRIERDRLAKLRRDEDDRLERERQKAKEEELRLANIGPGWLMNFDGYEKNTIGPRPPARSEVEFKTVPVVFTLEPTSNMQLVQFEYFGNDKTGIYSITFECLTCEGTERRKMEPIEKRTTLDQLKSVQQQLNTGIGFSKNHKYKIYITPSEGVEMGFVVLDKKIYSLAGLGTITFQSAETSVFNLVFEID